MTDKTLFEFQRDINLYNGLFTAIEIAVRDKKVELDSLKRALMLSTQEVEDVIGRMEVLKVVVKRLDSEVWETVLHQIEWEEIKYQIAVRKFDSYYPSEWIKQLLNTETIDGTDMVTEAEEELDANNEPYTDNTLNTEKEPETGNLAQDDLTEELFPVFLQAIEYGVEQGEISVPMIQQKFSMNLSLASNMLRKMEEMGIVGSGNETEPRPILLTLEQWLTVKDKQTEEL